MFVRWLVSFSLLLLVATACTRSRSSDFPSPDEAVDPGTTVTTAASITVLEPAAGASVGSPVPVEGRVELRPNLTLAAQVRSREADGTLIWRGNGPLAVNEDGSYSGTIEYALDGDSAGVVEVIIIEPGTGTVLETQPVEVSLRATR